MPRKKKQAEPPVNLWGQYPYLYKPIKKITRLAEIARAAAQTQIQVPVERRITNERGEQEIQTQMTDAQPVGQYEEILRLLLMKCLNSCDVEEG